MLTLSQQVLIEQFAKKVIEDLRIVLKTKPIPRKSVRYEQGKRIEKSFSAPVSASGKLANTLRYEITDTQLIIWGKVERRDEQVQLIVEDAEKVDQVTMVLVELSPQQAAAIEEQNRLNKILQSQVKEKENRRVPVIGIVQGATHREIVKFGRQFWVQDSNSAVQALQNANFRADVKYLTNSFN